MFSFRADTIPSNIYVVGCGGTGSRLIPALVQFIRSITKEHVPTGWLGTTNIVLIDGDIVEQKNLIRQNFIQNDVNKNKAAVLANRYGKHFGMNVVAYPHFIEATDNSATIKGKIANVTGAQLQSGDDLVIMCVDSAKARRLILNALCPYTNSSVRSTFIDAGNEDSFGQVRMFNNVVMVDYDHRDAKSLKEAYKLPDRIELDSPILSYIPYDPEFYRNMQDNPGLGSCADLDQTLAINSLMAMYILSFVQNLYYRKVLDYNEVSIDIVRGSTAYTKNTVTNYRNKTIISRLADSTNQFGMVGYGYKYGLLGMSEAVAIRDVIGSFLTANTKVVKAMLKEQEQALAAEKLSKQLSEIKKLDVQEEIAKKKEQLKELRAEPQSNFRQLVQRETELAAQNAAPRSENNPIGAYYDDLDDLEASDEMDGDDDVGEY